MKGLTPTGLLLVFALFHRKIQPITPNNEPTEFVLSTRSPPKPFAQPLGRRAMTPPPRFQGPPRNIMHPAAGSRGAGPRAFSSASGRMPPKGPAKPAPPPEPLHVLPSPHLIKDDMSILPIDYAPPTLKERVEGRPESPRGGLRPYTSMSRAHTPLVSSFDDLAAIPSP